MFRSLFLTTIVVGAIGTTGCAKNNDAKPMTARSKIPGMMGAAINPKEVGLITINQVKPKMSDPIFIASAAFQEGGVIPHRNSDYGEKVSPELHWTGVPDAAQSLVILCEDPDAKTPKPFIHWVMYNVPPKVTALREALPGSPRLTTLDGALQGLNSRGSVGYMGPRPPKEDGPHHYHFQIFALDVKLSLDPAADRKSVVDAMKGHVLAQGLLLGTFDAQ